jgi:hypothetical protein
MHPLQAITSIISHRLQSNGSQAALRAIVSDEHLDDNRWVALASRHRVTPALAACLNDLKLLSLLPDDLRIYFEAMLASNTNRNQTFLRELGCIVGDLNSVGVEPCLLKGATRLIDGLYPDLCWRFMSDLDLLVPKARLEDCNRALMKTGYQPFETAHSATHHSPALWHPEREAVVELHWQVRPRPYHSLLPTHDVLARSSSITGSFGRLQLLHPDDQATLVIAHAQIFDGYFFYGILRLADLIEIERLSAKYTLDWPRILDGFGKLGWLRSCKTFLLAANNLLGMRIPNSCNIDPLTRLANWRCISQQYWRPAMAAGIYSGWLIHACHRLMTIPDRQDRRRLVNLNLNRHSKDRFPGLRKRIDDNLN